MGIGGEASAFYRQQSGGSGEGDQGHSQRVKFGAGWRTLLFLRLKGRQRE